MPFDNLRNIAIDLFRHDGSEKVVFHMLCTTDTKLRNYEKRIQSFPKKNRAQRGESVSFNRLCQVDQHKKALLQPKKPMKSERMKKGKVRQPSGKGAP